MRARAALPLAAAVVVAVALPGQATTAPAAEKAGWWSATSGGGAALPQPSTADGDLRVARGAQASAAAPASQPAAFAALLYRHDGTRATLQLKFRDQRVVGTPDIAACPTKDTGWTPGGNQPAAAAPQVDCGASTSFGTLAADGTSVSFTLDSRFQVEPGVWSVALVPTPGDVNPGPPPSAPLPFSADLVAPEPGAFTAESDGDPLPASDPVADSGTGTGPAVPAATGDGSATATLPGGFSAGSVPAPADTSGLSLPSVAGAAGPTSGAAPAPAVAAPTATSRRPVRPAAASAPTVGTNLLVLAALVALAAWLGRESSLPRTSPRLLGGRARLAGATAAGPADAPAGPPSPEDRPRGLGQFARVRDAAPRRLR